MFSLNANKEDVMREFPQINSWMEKINSLRLDVQETDLAKAEFYYTCGFFIPKVKDKVKYYTESFEKTSKMLYPERLEFELSKLRINITMKIGNFEITDRMPKGIIPEEIRLIIAEITKVKMIIESEQGESTEITNSIPPIDGTRTDTSLIKYMLGQDPQSEASMSFDMDAILDKISKNGIDSLTSEEKDFLDGKSKEM